MNAERLTKIIVSALGVVLLAGVAVGLMASSEQRTMDVPIDQVLYFVADSKANEISQYLASHEAMSSMLAQVPGFIDAVDDPTDPQALLQAQRIINLTVVHRAEGLTLLDVNGTILAQDPALDREFLPLPREVLDAEQVVFERYYDPVRASDYFAVIAPVSDRNGTRAGRVMYDVSIADIDLILDDIERSVIGEVYLIDRTGTLLSTSRYSPERRYELLVQEVRTEQSQACMRHNDQYLTRGHYSKTHNPYVYTNYLGEQVFGNHAHVFDILGCVIAETSVEKSDFSMTGWITNRW